MLRTLTLACVAALGMMDWTASTSEANHYYRNRFDVQYRLPYWKDRTFTCPIEARNFELDRLSKGFEVVGERHGSHIHVRYRMLRWTTYDTVRSHYQAHDLQGFLASRGYQTRIVNY